MKIRMRMYTNALLGKRLLCFIIDAGILLGFTYMVSTCILYLMNFNFKAYNDSMNEFIQNYSNYLTYGGDLYYESFKESFRNYISFAITYYSVRAIVSFVFCVVYFVIIPNFWKKQTLGRLATKTIVISHSGNPEMTIPRRILREILGTWILYYLVSLILGGVPLIVSGIVYLISGRSLIDLISRADLVNDYVIEIDENLFNKNNDPNSFQNYDSNQYNPNRDDFRPNDEKPEPEEEIIKEIPKIDESSDDEYDVF